MKINKTLATALKKQNALVEYVRLINNGKAQELTIDQILRELANNDNVRNSFVEWFTHYMKEKNLWETFKQEQKRQDRKINANNLPSIIDYSLTWDSTKQGFDFWSKENSSWGKYVRQEIFGYLS